MTNDDVRRAAERRSAMLKASNDHDGGYPDSDEGRKQSFYDMAILADAHVAYLAQQREEPLVHPSVESPSHRLIAETLQRARASVAQQREEDDDKPIDGLWLASLGPLKRGDYELQISVDGYCAWWHGDRGMYLCHAHTRGQVRRLLEALGIWEAQPDQGKEIAE